MVLTYIKRIRHSMRCVTGVYLRDITHSVFAILHLNGLQSMLSSCIILVKVIHLSVHKEIFGLWLTMIGWVFVCVFVQIFSFFYTKYFPFVFGKHWLHGPPCSWLILRAWSTLIVLWQNSFIHKMCSDLKKKWKVEE